ncbi:hypothetical protein [Iningainema tapete]|uniref:Uncharacterized protein n=1 Tax=Iningainema tapete BLCC-T55 TaxID=2748662 RepID=A0A8J7C854_9CYAN|nr:hypothetical protein [Iningainema tapete]MBD2774151.1 hypothetical protein [Iningainema tapete BLCC-T55]
MDELTGSSYSYSFDGGSNSNSRPQLGPFDRLLDIEGVDGPQDIFGNIDSSSYGDGSSPFGGGSGGSSPFGSGSGGNSQAVNPFAGENFWNIFAGGVNPDEIARNNSFGGSNNSGGW